MLFSKKRNYNSDDLSGLITGCVKEETSAQRLFVESFYNYGASICRLYSRSSDEVEEMVNDGFLKVMNNLQKYDHSKPFKTWFRAIFVNCCIDYYRKYHKHDNIISLEQTMDIEIESSVIGEIAADELLVLVQKLPYSCRMVFTLYIMEGYNHKEIGALMGIQEGTSKSNLRDARIKLKKLIQIQSDEIYHNTSIQIAK